MLSVLSLLAIAAIIAAIVVAWSGRFLAVGAIVMANVVIHAMTAFGPTVNVGGRGVPIIHLELGLNGQALAAGEPLALLQLVTSMFVHADFFHLFFNLLILLAFALPFEERIGHRRFAAIYLGSGLLGSLVFLATTWNEPVRLIGASGAVFGIIGAFAAAYPRLVVPLPLPLLFLFIMVRMRVIVAAMVFGALQVVYLLFLSPLDSTAYMAHIGGLVAGAALGLVVRKVAPVEPSARTRFDVTQLLPFAQNPPALRAYDHLSASQDEPEIFMAWLEVFWRHAVCPDTHEKPTSFAPGIVRCADHEHKISG